MNRLTARTEGWPASLQLAGLSLKGGADPSEFVASFGATDRFVLDYLSDEVMATLSGGHPSLSRADVGSRSPVAVAV